jgi:hypothetical protein
VKVAIETDKTVYIEITSGDTSLQADSLSLTIRQCDEHHIYFDMDELPELIEALQAVQKEFENE